MIAAQLTVIKQALAEAHAQGLTHITIHGGQDALAQILRDEGYSCEYNAMNNTWMVKCPKASET